jgi:hypothetical protein
MNTGGEISVELKLALDSLRRQAKDAASILSAALSSGSGVQRTAVKEQDAQTAAVKRTTDAIKAKRKAEYDAALAAVEGFRKARAEQEKMSRLGWMSAEMRQKFAPEEARLRNIAAMNLRLQRAAQRAAGAGLASNPATMFGNPTVPPPPVPPTPPTIPGGAPAPAGGGGARGLMFFAQLGAALAGLRVAIGIAKFAFEKLIAPLRMVAASAEAARRIYARQLQTGLGGEFTVRRSILADAIGVGEDEVMNYGKAISALNGRFAYAIKVMTETTPALTATGWRMRELNANMAAAAAEFAVSMKNVTDAVLDAANKLTKYFSETFRKGKELRDMLAYAEEQRAKGKQVYAYSQLNGENVFKRGESGFSSFSKEFNEKWQKDFKDWLKANRGDVAPTPTSTSSRLPSSPWERMGLVLGTGGADHARATAENTKRIANLTEKFVQILMAPAYDGGTNKLHAMP